MTLVNARRWRWAAAAAAVLVLAPAAVAQEATVITAGPEYRAGPLWQFLFGRDYRAAWTTPVRIQVLDPERFAGGLTVEGQGGGLSTESLRLVGRDRREYVFRSVNKKASRAVPEDLQGTFIQDIAQDQTAAKHPAAAVVVPPILRAVGVLHVSPTLFVMPNHPFLGQYRQTFAGRLGQLEERPVDGDDNRVAFAGAGRVDGTEDFLDELEEEADNRVNARDYLTARLVDMMMGDWDRHPDQWRWARFDRGRVEVWDPIPRDRDNAFARHEGLVMGLARNVSPQLTRYGPGYGNVYGLHYQATALDRQLLSELDRRTWDSVASFIRSRVTDAVIDSAVRRLPAEYYAVDGGRIRRDLTARRDSVGHAAREFFALLNQEVDVHASDAAETARIVRAADGSVTVTVSAKGDAPSFQRRFLPDETREVRLFLRGGDDVAEVTGQGPGRILVRVIGGGGDDRMADRSVTGGGRATVFYDDRGDNTLEAGSEAKVDTRAYEQPVRRSLTGNPPPLRDYGTITSLLTPTARWETQVGPVLGFGPSRTRFGFRRQPHAGFVHGRAVWAPLAGPGFGAEVVGNRVWTNRPTSTSFLLSANNFETTRFHGYGNDSPEVGDDRELYIVRHDAAVGQLLVNTRLAPGLTASFGPEVHYRDARAREGSAARVQQPDGVSPYFQAGALGRLQLDRRDTLVVTRSGFSARAEARAFGWEDGAPFARLHAQAATYVPISERGPSLAFRAGAERALGDFPFQEAAFVGGSRSLRGYVSQRFAGDAALFGSAELRQPIGQVRLIARGRLGVIGFADAGRVYVDGDSPDGWHSALGAGAWFETIGRILGVTYAKGSEEGQLYLHLGLPF